MNENSEAHQRHRGFIAFCETKLRYEKGFRAWIFLGPYLLGAVGLERMIAADQAKAANALGPWIGFLAYLVLFPAIWRRIVKFVALRKVALSKRLGSSAIPLP